MRNLVILSSLERTLLYQPQKGMMEELKFTLFTVREQSSRWSRNFYVHGVGISRKEIMLLQECYKKHGRPTDIYEFLNLSTVAHVDAHLVKTCKFPMALVANTI
jgi:hypothetical protein